MKQIHLGLCAALLVVGCGGSVRPAEAPPQAASQPPAASAAPRDPFAMPSTLENDPVPSAPTEPPDLAAWKAASATPGIAPAPASCVVAHKPAAKKVSCKDEASARTSLDAALKGATGAERDRALAALGECTLPPGFLLALRAELGAAECADVLVDPLLSKGAAEVSAPVLHVLVGQSLAAKLARSVEGQPLMRAPYTKAAILAFLKDKLAPWASKQAVVIQALSDVGAKLSGTGQAIAAAEAGRADLRFVEAARKLPVAAEFEQDPELKSAYENALEQALEPRKQRGRDAALVGLRGFASQGVYGGSTRMRNVRTLVTQLYAGRRVDALDGIMLPSPYGAARAPVDRGVREVMGQVPVALLEVWLPSEVAEHYTEHESLVARAFPPSARKLSSSPVQTTESLAVDWVRAWSHVTLAATHFRRGNADAALSLLSKMPKSPERDLLFAVALVLHQGPKDVVTMMASPTPAALGFRDVSALDAIAAEGGRYAGQAAFDAALFREVAPPDDADAAYFEDLARRYRRAASLLVRSPSEAARAEEGAKHAEELARAVNAP